MRRVCITIDTEFPDRPCNDPLGVFDELLAILAARSIPATFFVVGSWARANPDRVAAIHAAGHRIGNHSYSHCNLSRMTDEGIAADLVECRQALEELGVETRPWFRAPYGEMTSGSHVRKAVERVGYRHVPWNADGEDWRPGASAQQIVAKAFSEVKRRWPRAATVLFHSWPDATSSALPLLLDQLRASGANFTTVDQVAGSRWRRHLAPDPS